MSLTKAQLEARVAELEERNSALENRTLRERYACPLWDNPWKQPDDKRPDWTGPARLVVPAGAKPGDPLWIDFSLWPFVEGVSPGNYGDPNDPDYNPPVFTGSISPCPPDRARELERKREIALAERRNR